MLTFLTLFTLLCVSTVDAGSRCCDGTYSSSEGSGTCSYHGGVCDSTYYAPPVISDATKKDSTKWGGPNRAVMPGGPGEASQAAYWSSKDRSEYGAIYGAVYKCFGNAGDDQVSLYIFDRSFRPVIDDLFTTKWVFTFSDDSIKEYNDETWITTEDNYINFTSSDEVIEKAFTQATDVSVVWKEDGNYIYNTWNLSGSMAAVAATKKSCGIK